MTTPDLDLLSAGLARRGTADGGERVFITSSHTANPAGDFDEGETCLRGCGHVHQRRERKVPCSRCRALTADVHGLCDDCWLAALAEDLASS